MKARFFRHLSGFNDASAVALYIQHIVERVKHRWEKGLPMDRYKRKIADYTEAAIGLHYSMRTMGYDYSRPVDVDPNGELLGGAHRVACALALGLKEIPVVEHKQKAWAPAWDAAWFLDHGFGPDLVKELSSELDKLAA